MAMVTVTSEVTDSFITPHSVNNCCSQCHTHTPPSCTQPLPHNRDVIAQLSELSEKSYTPNRQPEMRKESVSLLNKAPKQLHVSPVRDGVHILQVKSIRR